jgi:hypothetical protein
MAKPNAKEGADYLEYHSDRGHCSYFDCLSNGGGGGIRVKEHVRTYKCKGKLDSNNLITIMIDGIF